MSTDFDFLADYGRLTTAELLSIVRDPDKYQPAAVVAAQSLLTGREITEAEQAQTDEYLDRLRAENEAEDGLALVLKAKIGDLLEPVTHPQSGIDPQKWVNLLLVGLGILYCIFLISFVRRLFRFNDHFNPYQYDLVEFYNDLPLIYMPVIAWLLYKRRKLGWIMLMVDKMLGVLAGPSLIYTMIKYPIFREGNIGGYIWPIFLNCAFVLFLSRKEITTYVDISQRLKCKTLIGTAIFYGSVVMISLFWFY